MSTFEKWQVVGILAAIAQTLAVIVSLFLILRQIRQQTQQLEQQTKLTRIANTQELVNLSSPFNLELIKDHNMAALWVNGLKEYNQFDEVKKYQYEGLLIWWLILHENIFYQWKKGMLEDEAYNPWKYDLQCFVEKKLSKSIWDELKAAFQSEFRARVTNMIK